MVFRALATLLGDKSQQHSNMNWNCKEQTNTNMIGNLSPTVNQWTLSWEQWTVAWQQWNITQQKWNWQSRVKLHDNSETAQQHWNNLNNSETTVKHLTNSTQPCCHGDWQVNTNSQSESSSWEWCSHGNRLHRNSCISLPVQTCLILHPQSAAISISSDIISSPAQCL